MFDRILNVTLSEEKFFTTGITQGNLELLLRPNSLLSHTKNKYKNIKSWTGPTPSFP